MEVVTIAGVAVDSSEGTRDETLGMYPGSLGACVMEEEETLPQEHRPQSSMAKIGNHAKKRRFMLSSPYSLNWSQKKIPLPQ